MCSCLVPVWCARVLTGQGGSLSAVVWRPRGSEPDCALRAALCPSSDACSCLHWRIGFISSACQLSLGSGAETGRKPPTAAHRPNFSRRCSSEACQYYCTPLMQVDGLNNELLAPLMTKMPHSSNPEGPLVKRQKVSSVASSVKDVANSSRIFAPFRVRLPSPAVL